MSKSIFTILLFLPLSFWAQKKSVAAAQQPAISLTTNKAKGEKIEISLVPFEEANSKTIWIDLNGNAKKDKGEEVKWGIHKYTIDAKTINIYGVFENVQCEGQRITHLEVMDGSQLKELWCSDNLIATLNLSKAPKIRVLYLQLNHLKADELQRIVAALPDRSTDEEQSIITLEDKGAVGKEQNKVTPAILQTLKAKKWIAMWAKGNDAEQY